MYDDDVDGTTTQAGSEVWKSPTLSPRVIYLLMIIELNSYIHGSHILFYCIIIISHVCVSLACGKQAMSRARARILSSRVGRLEGPVQALEIGIALRTELMEIGGGFD